MHALAQIGRELCRRLDGLSFDRPTTHVYNPLIYARTPHELYLSRFGDGTKQVLFLGMNPGPFGMAQTGVPFGDVTMVQSWLGIEGKVGQPNPENPARPVSGFSCTRREVSGTRLWGWARDRFGTPDHFFVRHFVANYCPLVFMEESGKNRTPDKLSADERTPLFAACDEALRQIVRVLRPTHVIGVGAFAEGRAREALRGHEVEVRSILHPSPASPAANRDWAGQIERQLTSYGLSLA